MLCACARASARLRNRCIAASTEEVLSEARALGRKLPVAEWQWVIWVEVSLCVVVKKNYEVSLIKYTVVKQQKTKGLVGDLDIVLKPLRAHDPISKALQSQASEAYF